MIGEKCGGRFLTERYWGRSSAPEVPSTASQVNSSELNVSDLEPGGKSEGWISVNLRGYLDPIKFSIQCNGKTYPVKLTPETGALIKPLPLSSEDFSASEARISGMHEAQRRYFVVVNIHACV